MMSPQGLFPDCRGIVVMAVHHPDAEPVVAAGDARKPLFHAHRQVHRVLALDFPDAH